MKRNIARTIGGFLIVALFALIIALSMSSCAAEESASVGATPYPTGEPAFDGFSNQDTGESLIPDGYNAVSMKFNGGDEVKIEPLAGSEVESAKEWTRVTPWWHTGTAPIEAQIVLEGKIIDVTPNTRNDLPDHVGDWSPDPIIIGGCIMLPTSRNPSNAWFYFACPQEMESENE